MKRLVFKSVPDESTRLAMLKRGEADIAYSIRGALAEELRRTPGLTLKPNYPPGTFWLVFPEQWTAPKSPWADKRVRLAASHAIDRQAINQAETLGFSKITGSIVPHDLRVLLAGAGAIRTIPRGQGSSWPRPAIRTASTPASYYCDAVVRQPRRGRGQLSAGRGHPRPAASAGARGVHQAQNARRSCKNIIQTASGASGNAATRLDAFVAAGGTFTYGSYPDIDGLIREQASEMDVKKREAILHRIQQLIHEQGDVRAHLGAGVHERPRPARGRVGAHPHHRATPYSAPYEDLKLKAK